ncbi:HNH endonuclease [Candidatus Woesearchaeota archaeon]|nr:HNH endonuclease [Candidatus Woesearchaeota archaeon]
MPNRKYEKWDPNIGNHRKIAQRVIGRWIRPEEVVHHINHKWWDNKISNLLVFETQGIHKTFENKKNKWLYGIPRTKMNFAHIMYTKVKDSLYDVIVFPSMDASKRFTIRRISLDKIQKIRDQLKSNEPLSKMMNLSMFLK